MPCFIRMIIIRSLSASFLCWLKRLPALVHDTPIISEDAIDSQRDSYCYAIVSFFNILNNIFGVLQSCAGPCGKERGSAHLKCIHDCALNRDLMFLCMQINEAALHLPEGGHSPIDAQGTFCCIFPVQNHHKIP
jgi:hypothetical protein